MPKEYRITGEQNKSIGYSSSNPGSYAVALGANTTANGDQSVAIGQSADAYGTYAISIGNNSVASTVGGVGGTVIGGFSYAHNYATAVGYGSSAIAYESVSIGRSSKAGSRSVALGSYSNAFSDNCIVINATGSSFPDPGTIETNNVYISSIHNLDIDTGLGGTPDANVISVGGRVYGMMYCNVETGQICVIGQ